MKLIRRDYEKGYHEHPFNQEKPESQRNHERLRLLLSHRQDGRLLEVGCGTGGFLRMAAAHFEVEGVDLSRHAIEVLRPEFGERVSVLDIAQKPLPRARWDAIIVFNILEHVRQPHRVLEKLHAALAPGGLLLGSVPNNYPPVGSVHTLLTNFFDRTHVSTFDPATWRRIFTHAGFTKAEFFGEVTLGHNRCRYLTGRLWPFVSFNLMFSGIKG